LLIFSYAKSNHTSFHTIHKLGQRAEWFLVVSPIDYTE